MSDHPRLSSAAQTTEVYQAMTHIAIPVRALTHRVCSPSPIDTAYQRIIRSRTVKVLDFVQFGGPTLGKPSHQRQDGRSLRGDPRAPIPSPDVRRGTGCSGHSPGGTQTLPDPQEQVPETPPSRHPQHRAKSPRRLSRWATPPGSGFAMPNHRQAGRTAGSTPDGTGVRTKAPEAVASSPHFHIPTGVPQLEPDRFHPYPRAPSPVTG